MYKKQKQQGAVIPEVSRRNAQPIRQYIINMEKGINIGKENKKGDRSYIQLNSYSHQEN